MCAYVATTLLLLWLRLPLGHLQLPLEQWTGLISVALATLLIVASWERGRWPLGLFVRPLLALRDFAFGSLFGAFLVGGAALLVVLTTQVRHAWGGGFPWREALAVYLPAAVHEELLFRGYGFQKLYAWRPGFALWLVALFFAALHLGNPSLSWIGIANIFLGGLLLGLAYARYGRLWLPIGLHLAWNLMSGPILGHEVSGYESLSTVLVELGDGPEWLTGGEFGIEGSIWMTVAELVGIAVLARRISSARRTFSSGIQEKESI
ncbi:MAG TPA: CPBP family intramembrane glutamic endopeptidase [Thermoanaerobaculia bacterium]|nr:CPBP family intramembrane glutamic endopeptidase [Thermoanaerobaculia bacterium]